MSTTSSRTSAALSARPDRPLANRRPEVIVGASIPPGRLRPSGAAPSGAFAGAALRALELPGLIEQVYDCAKDPTLWPGTLERIAALLGSRSATLGMVDRVSRTEWFVARFGDGAAAGEVRQGSGQGGKDYLPEALWTSPIDAPATDEEMCRDGEHLGSRIYLDWAAAHGCHHMLLSPLLRSGTRLTFVGFSRPKTSPAYGLRERGIMTHLAPHLRRAVALGESVTKANVERDVLAGGLDVLSLATLIVDGTARLIHCNAAGEALLGQGDLLTLHHGFVEPWSPRESGIARLPIVEVAGSTRTRTLPVWGRSGDATLLSLARLTNPAMGSESCPRTTRVAVYVQGRAELSNDVEAVGLAFGLTGAELKILKALSTRGSAADVADRCSLALSTVKTHIKRIFEKTGTHRQKDLIGLLNDAPRLRL